MTLNIINPPSSGGVGVEVDPNSLHLTGGTMGVNARVIFPTTNGEDSEVGAWGFGVEKSTGGDAGSYSTVEPTQVTSVIYTDANRSDPATPLTPYPKNATFNANGISANWNDNENWSGSFNLNINGVYGGYLYSDQNYPENNSLWSFGVGGLNFSDGTVQTTALSGVSIDNGVQGGGGLNIDTTQYTSHPWGGFRVKRLIDDSYYAISQFNPYGVNFVSEGREEGDWQFNFGLNGILFPDSSLQTTAGIPEAPIDGNAYVRKDGAWVDITTL